MPSDGAFFFDGRSFELPRTTDHRLSLSALPLTRIQILSQNPPSIANRTSRSLPKPTRTRTVLGLNLHLPDVTRSALRLSSVFELCLYL